MPGELRVSSRLFKLAIVHFLTCRIASLCISWSLHAGIISFSTPNSSFIFERLRRSIRLCAVFRAILRPAALLELGVLRLGLSTAVVTVDLLFLRAFVLLELLFSSKSFSRGFIWMILRERVGGGGSVKSSFPGRDWEVEARRREEFCSNLVDSGEEGGGKEDMVELRLLVNAGGGSANEPSSED